MQTSRSSTTIRLTSLVVGVVLAVVAVACSDTLRALAPNPGVAESHADQVLDALAARFNQVELAPKYDHARIRLAQSALVPSRIFNDTSIWEARPSAALRVLYINGATVGPRYRLEPRPVLTPPAHLGDTRHTISLEQLAPSVFRWETRVDFAVGGITADEVSTLFATLLRAPEGRNERDLRDDYRSAFPRSMAAFGRGFAVDSIHVTPGALGTTSVEAKIGFHPELMRPAFPAFASYVNKYLGPARYHFALSDRAGVALFDVVGRDRGLTIRYRLQQGQLVSLIGPPRPWPDSLLLTSDVSLKVKIFRVGFHKLVTDFVISNTGHDRSFTVVAQREPEWDLPMITERLIRSPLRRPFEGQGSLFRLGVRDSAGAQSLLMRRVRLDVQESALMRFVGSLASHAISELDAKVELEEDRFIHEGFTALRADLRALAGRWHIEMENRSIR